MILKVRFPIFIIPVLLLALYSCENKSHDATIESEVDQYESLINIAEKHSQQQQYDSAFYYFNKAKLNADPEKKPNRVIFALIKMAFIQQIQSDFTGSESTATEALPYLQTSDEPAYPAILYNILGIAYEEQMDYDSALKYYNHALRNTPNENNKRIILNNIAVIYLEKKAWSEAIKILLPLYQNSEFRQDTINYAKSTDNLGYSYFKTGKPDALDYLTQSLKVREKSDDHFERIASYIHLSEYYEPKDLVLSKQYALLAYHSASKVNSVDDRIDALKILIRSSDALESKKYAILQMKLDDSIGKVRLVAKNQFAKIKYDFTKTNEENLKLTIQSEKINNRNMLLRMGIGIIILIGIVLYLIIRFKNKKQQLKTAYDTETRIAKKLHDELANDVFNTMAFAETHDLSSENNKETLLGTLDTIYTRTRNISKENSAIDTGPDFVLHLKEMIAAYSCDSINLLVNGIDSFDWTPIEATKKIIVYRIILELLVNMKKHSQSSLVVFSFRKTDNRLHVEYSDNGVGLTSGEINLKNGLQNVENRIETIKGTISFDTKSAKGFKVSFSIPI